jgi:hypothetical protein
VAREAGEGAADATVYKTLVEFAFVPLTSLVIGWVKKREPSYGA